MKTLATKKKKRATTVSPNAFAGKAERPDEYQLAAALGPAKALWDDLASALARENEVDIREWNSYSTKAGWSLRLKHKDRNIVYLVPRQGSFQAAVVLGDKAVKVAEQSHLPVRIEKIISEAKRYAEGTGVRIDVQGPEDITAIKQLARIKLAN